MTAPHPLDANNGGRAISLMEPAFKVGTDVEGYLHGSLQPGACVRFTCVESCKRVDDLDARADTPYGVGPIWQTKVHKNEAALLDGDGHFSFSIPAHFPPSFRCYQNGVFCSCAYRLVLEVDGLELPVECFVHVVGPGNDTSEPSRDSAATKSMWVIPPKLRFGRMVFKLPVIFNISVPAALNAHAGAQLLVNMLAFTELAPEYLKLSIWRKVDIREQDSETILLSTTTNVQRFKARRPFVSGFEGTYFINVPKRSCTFSSVLLDVSYSLKVVLSMGLGRKIRHRVPLHVHHLFSRTVFDNAGGVKNIDWNGVHDTIVRRGMPTHCPICFDNFLAAAGASTDGGTAPASPQGPRHSAAGVAERVSDILTAAGLRIAAPPLPEETGGALDPAATAQMNEDELLREASVANPRRISTGGLLEQGGAAPADVNFDARPHRVSTPGRVEDRAAASGGRGVVGGPDSGAHAKELRSQTSPGCGGAAVASSVPRSSLRSSPLRTGRHDAVAGKITKSFQDCVSASKQDPVIAEALGDAPAEAEHSDVEPSSSVFHMVASSVFFADPPAADACERPSASDLMSAQASPCVAPQAEGLVGLELESSPLGIPGLLITDCCHAFHASCLLMYERFATLNTFTRPLCPVCRAQYRKHVARRATQDAPQQAQSGASVDVH